jgi:hypothetical protein
LFAVLAIIAVPHGAAAQDMPPILAPLAAPISSNSSAGFRSTSPSAEAIIPPAVVCPTGCADKQEHVVAAVDHRRLMTHHGPNPQQ